MGKYEPEEVTASEVQAYRENTGAGMMEAKRHLRLRNLATSMHDLRASATTDEKVDWILDRLDDLWWPA